MNPSADRTRDAARRAELAAAQRRGEAVQAQAMIDEFVQHMMAAQAAPESLQATLLGGQRVKTNTKGWYLKRNRSVAIGADAGYYVLTVPGGLRERVAGAKLQPSPPPLIVSQGGRDGEAGDLSFFLAAARERYLPG